MVGGTSKAEGKASHDNSALFYTVRGELYSYGFGECFPVSSAQAELKLPCSQVVYSGSNFLKSSAGFQEVVTGVY